MSAHKHEMHRVAARDEYVCHCGTTLTGDQMDAVRSIGWQPLSKAEADMVECYRKRMAER